MDIPILPPHTLRRSFAGRRAYWHITSLRLPLQPSSHVRHLNERLNFPTVPLSHCAADLDRLQRACQNHGFSPLSPSLPPVQPLATQATSLRGLPPTARACDLDAGTLGMTFVLKSVLTSLAFLWAGISLRRLQSHVPAQPHPHCLTSSLSPQDRRALPRPYPWVTRQAR